MTSGTKRSEPFAALWPKAPTPSEPLEERLRGEAMRFDQLRAANVTRCEQVFHKLIEWNALEWAGAMCGEAGEAANVAKKLKRLDVADADKDTPEERLRLRRALAEELADVVIYADLLAAREHIDLGRAVIDKFNKVSHARGARIFLRGARIFL